MGDIEDLHRIRWMLDIDPEKWRTGDKQALSRLGLRQADLFPPDVGHISLLSGLHKRTVEDILLGDIVYGAGARTGIFKKGQIHVQADTHQPNAYIDHAQDNTGVRKGRLLRKASRGGWKLRTG